jgi:IS30 family transposase
MYSHLTKETRIKFSALLLAGLSLRRAARLLGIHHTTLSRELRRNPPVRCERNRYHPGDAHRKTQARRRSANQRFRKIVPSGSLEQLLVAKIRDLKWAPEQCAGWLRTCRQSLRVCTQTIYAWIYQTRQDLVVYLHCAKGRYRRTRYARVRREKRAELATPRHISQRPAVVACRARYGDWEGDTVHGKNKSGYIATFVERKSGYLLAMLLPSPVFGSLGFADATTRCLRQIPKRYRRTLTLDNGPETKLPERIERTTGLQVYYATPYHSWERGTNENTNGLLRYFFPKKSSFAALTQKDIDQAVRLLNTRPRKRLKWRTPEQMLERGGAVWGGV